MGKYLVINAGSSSLKFSLYEMPEAKELVNGLIEKIGEGDSSYTLKFNGEKIEAPVDVNNHTEAVNVMLDELLDNAFIQNISEIKGVGHRIVHGGEIYSESTEIDDTVMKDIESLTKLAPLHHPGEIAGIKSIKKCLPDVPQIAVFDTAFHQSIPKENYLFAVPLEWYTENGVRKYGFHGTSHKYITEQMKDYYGKDDVNLIICHIGSGASISCIKDGKSYDTTMGLTALDGIIMGTRSGSVDPSIVEYVCKERGYSLEEAIRKLNLNSGLLGIAGKNDFRDLEEMANNGDKNAQLAITMLKNSIIKYIAQYYFELNAKLDALVFTAGIGENAKSLRRDVVNAISTPMNIKLDEQANNSIAKYMDRKSGIITTEDSNFDVVVLPTNEEYMILKDTYKLSQQVRSQGYSRVLKR